MKEAIKAFHRAPSMTTPLMLVHSRHDPTVGYEASERFLKKCGSRDKCLYHPDGEML